MALTVFPETHRFPLELHAMSIDRIVIVGIGAWETDHPPSHHVAIAAIDGIAEKSLNRHFQQHVEEDARRNAVKIRGAALERLEVRILRLGGHSRERSAARIHIAIDSAQRLVEELSRCERQLVALRRRSGDPRAAPVQALPGAPGTPQLLI